MMKMKDVLDALSREISEPLAKAIVRIKMLGMDKERALIFVTSMVEYAYANSDVREQMRSELKEKSNG